MKLVDVRQRERAQFQIMDQVRTEVLPAFKDLGLRTSVSQVAAITGGGGANKEVAYYVSGPDLRKLGEYAQRLTGALERTPGVVDVDTTLVLGKPEISVKLDRAKAAELGVQVADVAATLQTMVVGREISTYNEGGEQYEVHARALPTARTDADGAAARWRCRRPGSARSASTTSRASRRARAPRRSTASAAAAR